jgi:hypothetical protein
MHEVLHDPSMSGVAVDTSPEEMPVTVTLGQLARLTEETGVTASTLIANRVLPALFNRRHAAIVDRLGDVEDLLVEAAGPSVRAVLEAAHITEARRRIGGAHLARLRKHSDLPMLMVPELFTRATGRRVVSLVADALAEEID